MSTENPQISGDPPETRPAEAGGAAPVPGVPALIAHLFPLRVTSLVARFDTTLMIESGGPAARHFVLATMATRAPEAEQRALAEFLVDVANAAASLRLSDPPPEGGGG